jgi:hypothetical protein
MAQITDATPAVADESDRSAPEIELRRTLLAGLVGAVVGAAAYFIYSRLEEEQKEALRESVGKFVGDKIAGVRGQFKF